MADNLEGTREFNLDDHLDDARWLLEYSKAHDTGAKLPQRLEPTEFSGQLSDSLNIILGLRSAAAKESSFDLAHHDRLRVLARNISAMPDPSEDTNSIFASLEAPITKIRRFGQTILAVFT